MSVCLIVTFDERFLESIIFAVGNKALLAGVTEIGQLLAYAVSANGRRQRVAAAGS